MKIQKRYSFRLAYLTGTYPAASHTFIEREISALRALEADVSICSIRRPASSEIIGVEEQKARDETFYVLTRARNPVHLIAAHAVLFARAPKRWLETLGLAMRTNRPGLKGMVWQFFYFLEAGILASHLQSQKISHLHNHFGDSSATVAMLAANLARLPFSFTLHGPTEFFSPESWHIREKVARASLVVCISHFCRSQTMLFSDPEHWQKLRIVHCGVAPERYESKFNSARSEMKFLFVGRLTPVKGLRVLLEAFEIARTKNSHITLTVVGDGVDRDWVDESARRIGGIEVLGYRSQSDVAKILLASDALVLPSFAEGVPVALMEAMAARRPVIATRVGGVGELVEDGISGLTVAPGDVRSLAKAMILLASDPKRRHEMGKAGRAKVYAEFDINNEAIWLKELFEGRGGVGLRPKDTA